MGIHGHGTGSGAVDGNAQWETQGQEGDFWLNWLDRNEDLMSYEGQSDIGSGKFPLNWFSRILVLEVKIQEWGLVGKGLWSLTGVWLRRESLSVLKAWDTLEPYFECQVLNPEVWGELLSMGRNFDQYEIGADGCICHHCGLFWDTAHVITSKKKMPAY